jgi:predicted nucleic acid-binding protein
VLAAERQARGRRAVDRLIAATAIAHGLPLYTRKPSYFDHLDELLVIPVTAN